MTLDELTNVLGENTLSYSNISIASMANIMKFVYVSLQIDNKSLDYYYEISVEELLESDMPKEELDTLKKQGWSFSDNKKNLIVYLKNS